MTTTIDIRSFLGLTEYYRRFLENFLWNPTSLTKLTHKSVNFQWLEKYEKSFLELKERLITALILTVPSWSGDFIMCCDVSRIELGYVLMRNDNVITYT
jgi:hypothetical protein